MIFWILLGSVLALISLLALASWVGDGTEDNHYYDPPKTTRGKWASFLYGLAVVPSGVVVISGLAFVAWCLGGITHEDNPVEPTCRTELVALASDRTSGFEGHFFLGTGSISGGESQIITYVQRNSDGSVQLGEKSAHYAKVFEDAPAGEGWMTCSGKPLMSKQNHLAPWWHDEVIGYRVTGYEFHVPEGSVVRDFEVAP